MKIAIYIRSFYSATKGVLAALFSNEIMKQNYELRSEGRSLPSGRGSVATSIAAILLMLLTAFVISVTWQRQNTKTLLTSHNNASIIPWQAVETRLGFFSPESCDSLQSCTEAYLKNKSLVDTKEVSLFGFEFSHYKSLQEPTSISPEKIPNFWLVQFEIPSEKINREFQKSEGVVVALPELGLDTGEVIVDGKITNRLFAAYSSAAYLQKSANNPVNETTTISVLFSRYPTDRTVIVDKDEPLVFVTAPNQYRLYNRIETLNDALRRNWLSDMSRAVMAIFLLMMFLFVDSSAETFGMALYLGFECFAMSLDYGWLSLGFTDPFYHFCYFMGGGFRLFFILHLARLISVRGRDWVYASLALSVPYVLTMSYAFPLDTVVFIDASRDALISVFAIAICLRAAIYLAPQRLYWRQIALLIASIASLNQLLYIVELFVPSLSSSETWVMTYYVIRSASPYLLAMSAFVNISSLENRVRSLAKLEVKNQLVDMELSQAKDVQQSLAFIPPLPDSVSLCVFQRPQMQISGDCFHIDWHASTNKVFVLINDVTGHGIQAALKAASCQVMAHMLIGGARHGQTTHAKASFADAVLSYHDQLRSYFNRRSNSEDVFTFIGCELDSVTGQLTLYRSNFNFPLLLRPSQQNATNTELKWTITQLTATNHEIVQHRCEPSDVLLLSSDGIYNGSRNSAKFCRIVQAELDLLSNPKLDLDQLKNKILESLGDIASLEDDQTLILLQWTPNSVI